MPMVTPNDCSAAIFDRKVAIAARLAKNVRRDLIQFDGRFMGRNEGLGFEILIKSVRLRELGKVNGAQELR